MRHLKAVALVATLALALLAAPAQAGPLRIVFAGQSAAGNLDLFNVDPSGSDRQKVTSGPADDTFPTLSPARDLVVFTRDAPNGVRRLFEVSPSGTGLHVVPNTLDGGAPSWSPDGARIAFDASHGDGPGGIYTITPAGTARTQVTTGADDAMPDWSPDSGSIVFQRHGKLWSVRVDGTHLKKITAGLQPAWQPNGKHIAFVRDLDGAGPGKKLGLFTMNPNGSGVAKLTSKGQRPAWQPNSRHIVYATGAKAAGSKIRTILFGALHPQSTLVTAGVTPAW